MSDQFGMDNNNNGSSNDGNAVMYGVREQSPTFFRTCQHVPIGVGTYQPVRR